MSEVTFPEVILIEDSELSNYFDGDIYLHIALGTLVQIVETSDLEDNDVDLEPYLNFRTQSEGEEYFYSAALLNNPANLKDSSDLLETVIDFFCEETGQDECFID